MLQFGGKESGKDGFILKLKKKGSSFYKIVPPAATSPIRELIVYFILIVHS